MSTQTLTVDSANVINVEVNNRTTLEVTFSQVSYPLTLVGTPVNCVVTPSSIASSTNVFSVTFTDSTLDSFSFELKNSAPGFGTDGEKNFETFFTSGVVGNELTSHTDWINNDNFIYNTSDKIFGYDVPTTSLYGTTNGNYNTIHSGSTARIYTDTGVDVVTGYTNKSLTLETEIDFNFGEGTYGKRRNLGYIASPTFSAVTGDIIKYEKRQYTSFGTNLVWALNVNTGDWVELQEVGFTGTRASIPANGTYRIIIFKFVSLYTNETNKIVRVRINKFTLEDSAGIQKTQLTVSGEVRTSPTVLIETATAQEVGDSLIHLYELTLPSFDPNYATGDTLYFHNGLNFETGTGKNINFPNSEGTVLNTYIAFPIEVTGIENIGGEPNRPTLKMANLPALGRTLVNDTNAIDDETTLQEALSSSGIISPLDLLSSKLVIRTTLLKLTYSSTDTPSVPREYPKHAYILDKISGERNLELEIELANPADIERANIPARLAAGKYCSWEYQGALYGRGGCTVNGNSFDRFFDVNDRLITANYSKSTGNNVITEWNSTTAYTVGTRVHRIPVADKGVRIYRALKASTGVKPELSTKAWERIDICGKRIQSCRLRFQGRQADLVYSSDALANTVPSDTYLNKSRSLPFGGFPGSRSNISE
tara:strand:- start:5997 stop:7952 length:1956 start_codon:yes stop_codon:yes gene_type:complete